MSLYSINAVFLVRIPDEVYKIHKRNIKSKIITESIICTHSLIFLSFLQVESGLSSKIQYFSIIPV